MLFFSLEVSWLVVWLCSNHGFLILAVDFSTGDDPWPNFKLQKEFNAPGKSPPLSTLVSFCLFLFYLSSDATNDVDKFGF